jgi:hypothetical protein
MNTYRLPEALGSGEYASAARHGDTVGFDFPGVSKRLWIPIADLKPLPEEGHRMKTRDGALAHARTEMRKALYALDNAANEFQFQVRRIEREHVGDAASLRTAKKRDLHKADAFDLWKFHAERVRTMAAFITAEVALRAEADSR